MSSQEHWDIARAALHKAQFDGLVEESATLIDIAFSESLNLYCILSDGTWIGVTFPEAPHGTH